MSHSKKCSFDSEQAIASTIGPHRAGKRLLFLAAFLFLASGVSNALEWKQHTANGIRFRYAAQIGDNDPIRGVIAKNWQAGEGTHGEMDKFAHACHFAQFDKFDINNGAYTSKAPSQGLLDAAAAASGHKELKWAGAILQGLSAGGRNTAIYAADHIDRTIAVVLDHSSMPSEPSSRCPACPGVPMLTQATYSDLFQDNDRREDHFNWCKKAFQDYAQPCTPTIHIQSSGNKHTQSGDRSLHAVWLQEAAALRVPENIPTDGSKYSLVPVDIEGEGVVIARLAKSGTRTYHDDVKIVAWDALAKQGDPQKLGTFWMPGPKAAALYADWTKQNGGSVTNEYSGSVAVQTALVPIAAPGAGRMAQVLLAGFENPLHSSISGRAINLRGRNVRMPKSGDMQSLSKNITILLP